MELLDAADAAHPDPDDHPDPVGIGGRDLQPGLIHRHLRGRDGVLDERVHLLDLAPLDPILGHEVADLAHRSGSGSRRTRSG